MTWGGLGPSGQFWTININGNTGSADWEPPRGDVSGLIDSLIVVGIRGRTVSPSIPVSGDVYLYDGSTWNPTNLSVLVSGVGPHNLLSATHPDTAPSTPDEGDIIVGSGAPPKWAPLPRGQIRQQLRVSSQSGVVWGYDPIEIISSGSIVNLGIENHRVIVNKTVGSVTQVNLPPSPFFGQEVLIKDGKGDANQNRITVVPPSGQTIDGLSSFIMKQRYQSMHFLYNGNDWNIV